MRGAANDAQSMVELHAQPVKRKSQNGAVAAAFPDPKMAPVLAQNMKDGQAGIA